MAEEVGRAIDERRHLVVQAGTGTGKSLAYLVPAIRLAASGYGTVVVSTATIALQRQLVDRDLPRLAEALHKAIRSLENRQVGLARQVIAGDSAIDEEENAVEEECLKLLALHQPVAGDLRRITAASQRNVIVSNVALHPGRWSAAKPAFHASSVCEGESVVGSSDTSTRVASTRSSLMAARARAGR